MKSSSVLIITCLTAGIIIMGFIILGNKPWPVPDKEAAKANPVKSDAGSIAEGKELWVKHCQSCHGKTGHGDGTKAAQLKTEPGNFAAPLVQKQRDGSLFYKISEGREDMPSFKKKIPDPTDIWNLVNFMRTLK